MRVEQPGGSHSSHGHGHSGFGRVHSSSTGSSPGAAPNSSPSSQSALGSPVSTDDNQNLNMLPTDLASSLQTHSLFSTASMEFIVEIAKKMHVRPFKRGDIIIKEGDVGKAMFFILRGSVSIFSGSDNDIVVGDMHSGSFFGEISMFFNIPRTATIVAKTRCLLAVLMGDELHKVLQNYPDIAEHIRIEAENRMQFVKARMEAKGRKDSQTGVVESETFSSSRSVEQKLSDVGYLLHITTHLNHLRL